MQSLRVNSLSPNNNAQWVCRRSRKNSDVQIGRKGGDGIKFNGQVTAKRFWKKKSRKWHSWVRRSLQRFGQVCLNWSELSSRRRQIFSRIFMDAIFFYFIQSVSLSVTAGVTTCKDDISFFEETAANIFLCWINISLYLKLFIDSDATIKACLNSVGYKIWVHRIALML